MRKSIVFDFDGVIHKYSKGWQNGAIYDKPVDGIKEVISELHKDYDIYIVTTRARDLGQQYEVEQYLKDNGIEYDCVTSIKVPADVYIDDRAICFNPDNIDNLIKDIKSFLPWQKKPKQTII